MKERGIDRNERIYDMAIPVVQASDEKATAAFHHPIDAPRHAFPTAVRHKAGCHAAGSIMPVDHPSGDSLPRQRRPPKANDIPLRHLHIFLRLQE